MEAKLMELLKDEDFCVKFFDALENQAELNKLLEENGVVLDSEEVRGLVEKTKAQIAKADCDELNEEDLDDVSGGLVIAAAMATAIAVAYTVYRGKKSAEDHSGKKKK